jgi:hypothetical protein
MLDFAVWAYTIFPNNSYGAGSGSNGSLINWTPGFGPLLFIIDSKKLNIFIFIIFNDLLPILQHIIFHGHTQMSRKGPDPARFVVNCFPGSGYIIQDYGSTDPKEIFTDPQHCSQPCYTCSNVEESKKTSIAYLIFTDEQLKIN